MPGYLGVFVDSLAKYCEQITCFLHSPTAKEEFLLTYKIQSSNVNLVDLGEHTSVPSRLLRSMWIKKQVQRNISDVDVFLFRAPTPLLPIISKPIRDLPTALLLVGDNLSGVNELKQPFWRKEMIRLLWRWNKSQQMRIAKRSLTFVNSRKLYNELKDNNVPRLVETRTTTLSEKDFFRRKDTCEIPPYHLLYTGRIEKNKGLFSLIEATAILLQSGENIILDIVGWAASNDPIQNELHEVTGARGLQDRVIFHGYKSLGPELFDMYKHGDIYITAPLTDSEGFPRTIWEAMAHSLPVIATRVGSIPYFLTNMDNAVLIAPGDVTQLVQAIERVIADTNLRKRLIRNGMELARKNTLEKRADEMMGEIQTYLQIRNRYL